MRLGLRTHGRVRDKMLTTSRMRCGVENICANQCRVPFLFPFLAPLRARHQVSSPTTPRGDVEQEENTAKSTTSTMTANSTCATAAEASLGDDGRTRSGVVADRRRRTSKGRRNYMDRVGLLFAATGID